ncbi:MAG: 4-alpha-glucanotransferase [Phycisphaerae bacterium]
MANAAKSPKPTLARRSAGVLLHPTSLPGPHGCGDLGDEAYRFVEFLRSAGMRWWQLLPTTPIGPANSPYSSCSAFAGEPLLINLDFLADEELLDDADLAPPRGFDRDRVKYGDTMAFRHARLKTAYERFTKLGDGEMREDFERFCEDEASWLDDFSLFFAIKQMHRGKPWTTWQPDLRDCKPAASKAAREKLHAAIEYEKFVQFLYDRQWNALRHYCGICNVGIIGDLPIFVTHDSADVWARRELFLLDRDGRAKLISGCPPDAMFTNGQRWGHPHYAWPAHAREGFAWWVRRFAEMFKRFDAVRIDHFLGFHQTFQIPARAKHTEGGKYVPTPGDALFSAVRRALGKLEIVAEDLGNVTDGAIKLRDKHKMPGMRVIQNAFWDGARYDQPHNYPVGSAAYTGTHDTDTVVGWYRDFSSKRGKGGDGLTNLERIHRYLDRPTSKDIHWGFIRLVMASPASTAIVPMQDLLGLGSEARMNIPATVKKNWEWRMRSGAASEKIAERLRRMCQAYER